MNFLGNLFIAYSVGKEMIYWTLNLMTLCVGIYTAILCMRKRKTTSLEDNVFLLLDYDTSAYLIRGGNAASDFIIAALLSFYQKGAIDCTLSSFTTRKGMQKANYIFRPLTSAPLTDTEKCLYKILFTDYDEISTRELNRLRREAGTDYNEAFGNYLSCLEEKLQELGLKSKEKNGVFSLFTFLFSVWSLIFALLSVGGGFYFGCIHFFTACILLFLSIVTIGSLPPKGKLHYDFYTQLHQQLQEGKLKDEKETWILYAIAYGLPYKKVYDISRKVQGKDFHFYFDKPTQSTFHDLVTESLIGNMKLPR